MIEHYVATQGIGGTHCPLRRREFAFGAMSSSFSVEEIPLTDRYPDTGYAKNTECDLIVRIMKGRAILFTPSSIRTVKEGSTSETPGEKGFSFEKGDTLSIPKKTPYYWVVDVPSIFLIVSTPRWTMEQHRTVFL